ncbi:Uncharacterised protein [Mobiluncus mulieris]|nr:Uncharacterised protein [Mobiluncus mulieris]
MFGVILIMTLIALLQLTISEEIARRKQCQQLHALGVDNKDILSFGLATVLSTQLVSLLLTLLSLLFTAYRCSSVAKTSTIADLCYVMPLILICWVSICSFTLVIQTLGNTPFTTCGTKKCLIKPQSDCILNKYCHKVLVYRYACDWYGYVSSGIRFNHYFRNPFLITLTQLVHIRYWLFWLFCYYSLSCRHWKGIYRIPLGIKLLPMVGSKSPGRFNTLIMKVTIIALKAS